MAARREAVESKKIEVMVETKKGGEGTMTPKGSNTTGKNDVEKLVCRRKGRTDEGKRRCDKADVSQKGRGRAKERGEGRCFLKAACKKKRPH